MSGLAIALTDSATMLRRQLRHMQRYPSLTFFLVGLPVVLLLVFVYVFGGTLGAGLGAGLSGGRAEYLRFLVPGMLIMAIASGAQITAISVAMDMTEGIITRFRTMSISRFSVLAGHVVGSVLQVMLAIVVTIGVAVLMGFRPSANAVEWAEVIGLLALTAFAITWVAVALGLSTKSVETASNLPMFLVLLPFLGSGFVTTASMPAGLRLFAENQPFTPIIDTVRRLLAGAPVGHVGWIAVAWCVAIALVGYFWARWLYEHGPAAR